MKRLIVLLVAVCMSYPVLSLAGERENSAGVDAPTTVKSSKSNSQDRVGGAADPAADAAKINNTKSNTYRLGGAADPAAEGKTVKGSKSNTRPIGRTNWSS